MRKRLSKSDKVFHTLAFIFMALFSISFLFVLLWIFFSSMRSTKSFLDSPFNLFDINFERMIYNYEKAFTYKAFGTTAMPQMILNSLIYVVGMVALGVSIPAVTAYIVAKYKFRMRRIIIDVVLVVLVVPTIGSVSNTYRFLNNIGLLNTFPGVFLLNAGGFGFSFLLFRTFFSSIPWEYAESAFLDGGSNTRVMISIMMPQAVPIIISVSIMSFIGCWNDFYTPYMFLNSRPTVAYGLNAIYSKYQASMPIVFAAMTFTTAISLLIYCLFSKTIMESMSAGGLKG